MPLLVLPQGSGYDQASGFVLLANVMDRVLCRPGWLGIRQAQQRTMPTISACSTNLHPDRRQLRQDETVWGRTFLHRVPV